MKCISDVMNIRRESNLTAFVLCLTNLKPSWSSRLGVHIKPPRPLAFESITPPTSHHFNQPFTMELSTSPVNSWSSYSLPILLSEMRYAYLRTGTTSDRISPPLRWTRLVSQPLLLDWFSQLSGMVEP
jgi:hypothetical protein